MKMRSVENRIKNRVRNAVADHVRNYVARAVLAGKPFWGRPRRAVRFLWQMIPK